jgi:hypothetical protein
MLLTANTSMSLGGAIKGAGVVSCWPQETFYLRHDALTIV